MNDDFRSYAKSSAQGAAGQGARMAVGAAASAAGLAAAPALVVGLAAVGAAAVAGEIFEGVWDEFFG